MSFENANLERRNQRICIGGLFTNFHEAACIFSKRKQAVHIREITQKVNTPLEQPHMVPVLVLPAPRRTHKDQSIFENIVATVANQFDGMQDNFW